MMISSTFSLQLVVSLSRRTQGQCHHNGAIIRASRPAQEIWWLGPSGKTEQVERASLARRCHTSRQASEMMPAAGSPVPVGRVVLCRSRSATFIGLSLECATSVAPILGHTCVASLNGRTNHRLSQIGLGHGLVCPTSLICGRLVIIEAQQNTRCS